MKNIRLGIIIFARLGSKRFPKKVLKKIGFKSLLEVIIQRAKKVKQINKIVIACPDIEIDKKKISRIAKKENIHFYYGSNMNVYLRAKKCCQKYNFTHFIRLNADRPFFDYNLANLFIKKSSYNYDLITNNLKKKAPKGLTMELIKFEKFKKFKNMTVGEKEHICDYFYNKSKNFKILNIDKTSYNMNKKLSLGLDNMMDLSLTRAIYKKFNFNYLVSLKKIIRYYKKIIDKYEI